jgi:hypothetical protein
MRGTPPWPNQPQPPSAFIDGSRAGMLSFEYRPHISFPIPERFSIRSIEDLRGPQVFRMETYRRHLYVRKGEQFILYSIHSESSEIDRVLINKAILAIKRQRRADRKAIEALQGRRRENSPNLYFDGKS